MKRTFIAFLLTSLPFMLFSHEENFLLLNHATNEVVVEFGPHLNERMTSCSTFKIALSLMGYDAMILKDEENPT